MTPTLLFMQPPLLLPCSPSPWLQWCRLPWQPSQLHTPHKGARACALPLTQRGIRMLWRWGVEYSFLRNFWRIRGHGAAVISLSPVWHSRFCSWQKNNLWHTQHKYIHMNGQHLICCCQTLACASYHLFQCVRVCACVLVKFIWGYAATQCSHYKLQNKSFNILPNLHPRKMNSRMIYTFRLSKSNSFKTGVV